MTRVLFQQNAFTSSPLFSWLSGAEGLLAGGILLTLISIVIVSHHHEGVMQAYARAAG